MCQAVRVRITETITESFKGAFDWFEEGWTATKETFHEILFRIRLFFKIITGLLCVYLIIYFFFRCRNLFIHIGLICADLKKLYNYVKNKRLIKKAKRQETYNLEENQYELPAQTFRVIET